MMVTPADIKKINAYLYEIPQSFRSDMRVPARFYSDAELLKQTGDDRSLVQLVNTATLPGIVKYSLAMPDMHQGYGFPIGGVVATCLPDGIISPGGVGYDINCGVRLLGTHMEQAEVMPYLELLATALFGNCPSGVGKGGTVKLKPNELESVMETGAAWALKKGFASPEDLERTEEHGCMKGANPDVISQRAKDRGKSQLGTLGAGNHFIEVEVVDEIFDNNSAQTMGLFPGQIVIQIHCGSRGLGHQVCTDFVRLFQKSVKKFGFKLPDRELVCAPLSSKEGQEYLAGMKAAANYGFTNRQVLTYHIRRSFEQVLAGKVNNFQVYQVYDVGHNMAKVETHDIDGVKTTVCVHRKGATRAFGPGSSLIPDVYKSIGQPVLVPGSMGTSSWVLVGCREAMEKTFGSTCHGAGRILSRSAAKKSVQGPELRQRLESKGILIKAGSMKGLAEEAPVAYKDVNRVVEIVHNAEIAKKVARLKPLAVIKG
jgi:tRNA-splicing ligase RtcB